MTNSDLVPVTVIGGYLGAGKTTLINQLLAGGSGSEARRLAVLVNDFGSVNIDVDLIVDHDGETISLANGCICCSIADSLGESLDHVLALDPPVDQIVIEASGVADPAKVANYGQGWPGCRLDAVVVLVDAETIRDRASDQFVGEIVVRQLRHGDIIVLTKIDLVEAGVAADVTAWIATHTSAPVVTKTLGLGDMARLLDATTPRLASPEHAKLGVDAEQRFVADVLLIDTPIGRSELEGIVRDLPDQVVRAKGVVAITDAASEVSAVLVQRVGARTSLVEIDRDSGTVDNRLVTISRRF